MKPAIDFMKNEGGILCQLLKQHQDKLAINADAKAQYLLNPERASRKKPVPIAFKNSLRTVSLLDNEFHSVIDHPFTKKTGTRGQLGDFQECVNKAVANVISHIKGRKLYDPMFLTNDVIHIDMFGKASKEVLLDSPTRVKDTKTPSARS